MSSPNSFDEYFADNKESLLETWLELDSWKDFDAWVKDSQEQMERLKQEFLKDHRSPEFGSFENWARNAYENRNKPE